MYIGMGIALIAIGALLMMIVNWTVGLFLLLSGMLAIMLSFLQEVPAAAREVIIERRPAPRMERDRDIRSA